MKKSAETRAYVCHTYYHVYVSYLKELNLPKEQRGQADLILSTMTTTFKNIRERIEESAIFRKVIMFDEKRDVFFPQLAPYMNIKGNQLKVMLGRMKYTKLYGKLEEAYIPVDFKQYGDIYVFCDSDPIGYYLNYKKIYYHAVEDGLNTLKHCDAARVRNKKFFKLKTFLSSCNLIFIQNGYGKYCLDMEVNDISCLKYPHKKYVEVPRKKLVEHLSKEEKQMLLDVFIENSDEMRHLVKHTSMVLILTEPLCDMETRKIIFEDIITEYEKNGTIVIKPHPNDLLNYSELFDDTFVIDRKVPMEMMDFIDGLMFEKVVAVFTELTGIGFAKEKVRLGSDFMDKYEEPSIHRYNDNL
ncbi:MAG: lipooligosaccharide sialyltransferase [Lachnospiraceae bacterium]|nr:lipooligosaccharide sialyltransferase [Lachnospiraceae bacterium]